MKDAKLGDRVSWNGDNGEVVAVSPDGFVDVRWDEFGNSIHERYLEKLPALPLYVLDEVQPLIDALVSSGNDRPRLLSRQVAALMAESRGALTREERLQAAAMLLVAAGLRCNATEADEG